MNDKSKHIDKEFTDLAWKEMSLILDAEMPVKKPKRRFFWLWVVGFGLIIISSLFYLGKGNTPALSALSIVEKSNISVPETLSKNTDNQLVIQKTNTNISSLNKPTKKSSDDTRVFHSINILTPSSHSVEGISLSSTDVGTLSKKINTNSPKPTEVISPIQNNSFENLSIIDSEKGLNQQINQNFQHENLSIFDNIPTLNFTFLKLENLQLSIPKKPIKAKSKWIIGVFTGLVFPKTGGFRVGIITKYDLNHKWAIHLGLGYSKRTVTQIKTFELSDSDASEMNLDAVMNEDSMDITTPTSANNQPTNPIKVEIIPAITYSNFHYFDLPIFVQYKITPRWAVEIGGQISKLYGYQYAQDGQSYFSTNSQKLESNAIRLNTSFNEIMIPSIKEWQFAALGGISYTVNSKIQFYSNFHLGLNNYMKQEEKNHKWRQMEVGLRYYFK